MGRVVLNRAEKKRTRSKVRKTQKSLRLSQPMIWEITLAAGASGRNFNQMIEYIWEMYKQGERVAGNWPPTKEYAFDEPDQIALNHLSLFLSTGESKKGTDEV